MRLALVGYGKMGKEIEQLALEKGMTIGLRLDSKTSMPPPAAARSIDVVLHFAKPETVVGHVSHWAELGKAIVVGTTGWSKEQEVVRSTVRAHNIGLVYASNFSLGVHLFLRLLKVAGSIVNRFPEYDVFVQETHHKDKSDSPSGTALTIAETLLRQIERKKEILAGNPQGKIKPEQLHVTSSRAGAVVGTHAVTFDSTADALELKHTAKNRMGFALGALLAAEWIQGKKGMFTMDDVLTDVFRSSQGNTL